MTLRELWYIFWRCYKLFHDPLTLDIHLVDHCQLNCKGCNHYAPLAENNNIEPEKLIRNLKLLKKRINLNNFKKVYLLGGEPLLHPEINIILKYVTEVFDINKTEICIITNGILLFDMNESFWNICKNKKICIHISKYPISLDYLKIKDLCSKNRVKFKLTGDSTLASSFYQFKLSRANENSRTAHICNYYRCYSSCMQLVDDKIFPCSLSAYVKYLNKKINRSKITFSYQRDDFININKINWVKLKWFKISPKSFCRYCDLKREKTLWGISHDIHEWYY